MSENTEMKIIRAMVQKNSQTTVIRKSPSIDTTLRAGRDSWSGERHLLCRLPRLTANETPVA
jgi:hypothetical protein